MSHINTFGQTTIVVPSNKKNIFKTIAQVLCFFFAVLFIAFCIDQGAKEQILHDDSVIAKLKVTSEGVNS
ncbi:hypothetical protein [Acinetobacter nectaris]|uniref:hypothetical protein n=1 Tax=Acinetobacter nectaris TaxID=1219382 RepID=UPI001F43AE64|nr:hypothetical protein [Acinetobacter nectaris]MCF9034687.1 hypothetical protein [Acinetobacter nectaris]